MEQTKELVNIIIEKLCGKNLDYWWYDLDEEIQEEIKDELVKLILPKVSHRRELLFAYEKQTQINEFDDFDEWNTNKKIDQYLANYSG